MPQLHDTIAALATPAGTAAIAIVRISGSDTADIVAKVLGRTPPPRVATHARYRDCQGAVLDDVLVTFFAGPRSYTAEDAAEIGCHGNPFVAQKILEDLFARGCRPAEPGEFTQRAFLNGRLDLSQAEAVMDLIHARSEKALFVARQQFEGALSRVSNQLVDNLLEVVARVEAYIDFPEEDLPDEDRAAVCTAILALRERTGRLLATGHYGAILREGIKTVILGRPNVGKSSLLNQLVGAERALVSSEPGTTRDYIEERIVIGPYWLRIIDTAGLNPSPAPLEKLGMQKALERAAEADLFLLVVEATRPELPLPSSVLERLTSRNAIVVANKVDLAPAVDLSGLPDQFRSLPCVRVSAVTGAGLSQLREEVVARADAFQPEITEDVVAINARHGHALQTAQAALGEAADKLGQGGPAELVAADLRAALHALGEITGKVDNERMLDHLFAQFCIGK